MFKELKVSLKQRIDEDMKAAMRARDSARLTAIRMILAAVKQREVDERIQADDAVVVAVLERLSKQRKDSIDQFRAAGRDDLVAKESAELELLQSYLPPQLGEADLRAQIDAALAETGVTSVQGLGKVMGLLKTRLAGQADMARVSAVVKQRLQG